MSIQDLFGIELPIVQAPMAGVQGSALAISVSNAGGLGSLPCATLSLEGLRNELEAIRASTKRPFNVNFFCHEQPVVDPMREAKWRTRLAPYYAEHSIRLEDVPTGPGRTPFSSAAAGVLAEFRPPVVSFHFGLPSPSLIHAIRAWGAKLISTATTVNEALWLEANGADAIIAQGLEAGGHRGHFLSNDLTRQCGTFALLPQVVAAVTVPVIAAGGIASRNEIAAALALGASGVQVGTSYLLCPEATTSKLHRHALKQAGKRHTALTNIFTGRPARGIVNRAMLELGLINDEVPAFPLATSASQPLRSRAEQSGLDDFTPMWAGQNTSGCKETPASVLTRELAG